MKHLILFILLVSTSLLSFSQKSKTDTFNLFQSKKKEKRDAVKEIQSHPESKQGSVYYIKYGTSQGTCTGYCIHESTIDSTHIVTVSKSLATDKNYPVKTDTAQTISAQWEMLINYIDADSFFAIPKKIGNTDAGYEVTEWIELNYAGKIHKVTYDSSGPEEYEGIKNLSKLLKKITAF